eukprot:gene55352-2154_t
MPLDRCMAAEWCGMEGGYYGDGSCPDRLRAARFRRSPPIGGTREQSDGARAPAARHGRGASLSGGGKAGTDEEQAAG